MYQQYPLCCLFVLVFVYDSKIENGSKIRRRRGNWKNIKITITINKISFLFSFKTILILVMLLIMCSKEHEEKIFKNGNCNNSTLLNISKYQKYIISKTPSKIYFELLKTKLQNWPYSKKKCGVFKTVSFSIYFLPAFLHYPLKHCQAQNEKTNRSFYNEN